MNDYEVLYILPPDVEEEAKEGVIEKISKGISDRGGKVEKLNKWGVRTLAYPIKRKKEGYYVLTEFQMDPKGISSFDESLRYNDQLLRHLLVRREK